MPFCGGRSKIRNIRTRQAAQAQRTRQGPQNRDKTCAVAMTSPLDDGGHSALTLFLLRYPWWPMHVTRHPRKTCSAAFFVSHFLSIICHPNWLRDLPLNRRTRFSACLCATSSFSHTVYYCRFRGFRPLCHHHQPLLLSLEASLRAF